MQRPLSGRRWLPAAISRGTVIYVWCQKHNNHGIHYSSITGLNCNNNAYHHLLSTAPAFLLSVPLAYDPEMKGNVFSPELLPENIFFKEASHRFFFKGAFQFFPQRVAPKSFPSISLLKRPQIFFSLRKEVPNFISWGVPFKTFFPEKCIRFFFISSAPRS